MSVQEDNVDLSSLKVVVIKPNHKYEESSRSLERTHEEVIDCSNPKTYSVLTNKKHGYLECNKTRKYNVRFSGIISKIILEDFPIDRQYILNTNGINITTAKVIDGKQTFDITNSHKSNMVETFIKVTCEMLENEELKDNHLNFYKMDRTYIIPNIPLEKERYTIKLVGFFYNENKQLVEKTINYDFFTNEIFIGLRHPVREIILLHDTTSFNIYVRINDNLYGQFNSNTGDIVPRHLPVNNCNYIILCFKDFQDIYNGSQNEHLSDEHNNNSLNFSRLDYMSIIPSVGNIYMETNTYITYGLKFLNQVFSS